jgi:hypothetical protein
VRVASASHPRLHACGDALGQVGHICRKRGHPAGEVGVLRVQRFQVL